MNLNVTLKVTRKNCRFDEIWYLQKSVEIGFETHISSNSVGKPTCTLITLLLPPKYCKKLSKFYFDVFCYSLKVKILIIWRSMNLGLQKMKNKYRMVLWLEALKCKDLLKLVFYISDAPFKNMKNLRQ